MPKSEVGAVFEGLITALSPTIIAHPMHVNEELPEWLVSEIRLQRIIELLRRQNGEEVNEISDAEVVAYLYTASLAAPLRTEFARIYLFLAKKLLGERAKGIEAPEQLTDYELDLLKRLKRDLYAARERREKEKLRRIKGLMPTVFCPRCGEELEPVDGSWYRAAEAHECKRGESNDV